MNNKHCPVRSNGCWKERCAWWDEFSKSCAVLLLAQRFDSVTTPEDTFLVGHPVTYETGEVTCSYT